MGLVQHCAVGMSLSSLLVVGNAQRLRGPKIDVGDMSTAPETAAVGA